MAEGLYKSTGQVAAVIGNPGPGSANLLPGIVSARHEGVPVLATGTVGATFGGDAIYVGAKLGAPDRDVVCVTGDGAAGFNIMELQSAARENLEVTVVVCAEGSWTMEIPNELALYGKTFGTDMGAVRWELVAQGLGAHGEYVERIDDMPGALERARAVRGPRLICVRTDREANLAVPGDMMRRFFEVYSGPTA